MKAISIRSLRRHWPDAKALLQVEEEVLITRRSKPVAKLVLVHHEKPKRRKRWDPKEHAQWLKKVWGNKVVSLADKYVQADREDRLVQTSK